MGGSSPRIILILFFCAVTLFFFNSVEKFIPQEDAILKNGSFSDGLTGWRSGQAGEVAVEGGVVSLSQPTGSRSVWIAQRLPGNLYGHLRFSGDIRSFHVVPGEKAWNRARLLLISKDGTGKSDWHVPHNLITVAGDVGWITTTKDFRIYDHIRSLEVRALLSRASGEMQVRNLSVTLLSPNPDFENIQSLLIILWILLGFWVFAPVVTYLLFNLSFARGALLLLVVGVLVGTLLSTPYLNQVKSGAEKIAFESGLTNQAATGDDPFYDWKSAHKIGHFVAYTLLAFVIPLVFPKIRWPYLFFYLVVFAATTETLQLFSEGRTSQISDFLVNITGVTTGTILYFPFGFFRRHRDAQEEEWDEWGDEDE